LLNDTEARVLPNEILRIYNELEDKNEIKSVINEQQHISNIFPETLVAHYQNNHNKRLWQDEYRFIIGECLRTMKTEPDAAARLVVFNNLCNSLKVHLRGDDYSSELCIMNYSEYPLVSCVRDRVRMMQYFVNSPDFLYIGCSLELICSVSSPNDTTHGSRRLKWAQKDLSKQCVNVMNIEEVVSTLSPEAKEELVTKIQHTIKEAKAKVKAKTNEENNAVSAINTTEKDEFLDLLDADDNTI
jgi:hypothetical protein